MTSSDEPDELERSSTRFVRIELTEFCSKTCRVNRRISHGSRHDRARRFLCITRLKIRIKIAEELSSLQRQRATTSCLFIRTMFRAAIELISLERRLPRKYRHNQVSSSRAGGTIFFMSVTVQYLRVKTVAFVLQIYLESTLIAELDVHTYYLILVHQNQVYQPHSM